jgi:hypothetical protein
MRTSKFTFAIDTLILYPFISEATGKPTMIELGNGRRERSYGRRHRKTIDQLVSLADLRTTLTSIAGSSTLIVVCLLSAFPGSTGGQIQWSGA